MSEIRKGIIMKTIETIETRGVKLNRSLKRNSTLFSLITTLLHLSHFAVAAFVVIVALFLVAGLISLPMLCTTIVLVVFQVILKALQLKIKRQRRMLKKKQRKNEKFLVHSHIEVSKFLTDDVITNEEFVPFIINADQFNDSIRAIDISDANIETKT